MPLMMPYRMKSSYNDNKKVLPLARKAMPRSKAAHPRKIQERTIQSFSRLHTKQLDSEPIRLRILREALNEKNYLYRDAIMSFIIVRYNQKVRLHKNLLFARQVTNKV